MILLKTEFGLARMVTWLNINMLTVGNRGFDVEDSDGNMLAGRRTGHKQKK